MLMVFCSKCGKELPEDAYFCPACGAITAEGVNAGARTVSDELRDAFSKMSKELEKAFDVASREIREAFETAKENIRQSTREKTLVCANCGEKNAETSRFCRKCGKKLG
jgi:uncharacterized membrane protein YvbJ